MVIVSINEADCQQVAYEIGAYELSLFWFPL